MKKITSLLVISLLLTSACVDEGDEGRAAHTAERFLSLDAGAGENPFGVVYLDDRQVVVSLPFRKELRVYDVASTELVRTISTPASLMFMEQKSDGTLLAGSAALLDPAFDPSNPTAEGSAQAIANTGVWQVDLSDDSFTLLAQMSPDAVPTHFLELEPDRILVSNILGDSIYLLQEGTLEVWVRDARLAGDPSLPGPEGRPPFPVGIEGLARHDGGVLGAVADYGRLVWIPVQKDGSAGALEVLHERPTELLGLADIHVEGNALYAGSGFQSKAWHIDLNTLTTTLIADHNSEARVDTVGQITPGDEGEWFFTNNAFVINSEKGAPSPGIGRIVFR